MNRLLAISAAAAILAWGGPAIGGQAAAEIIPAVRAAIDARDLPRAEALIAEFRATRGTPSEAIEAISWMGRGALAAARLDDATRYATDAYDLSIGALKTHRLQDDPHLQTALGAAIETRALALVKEGARSDAVALLQSELRKFKDTPIHKRLAKNLNLLTLEGHPALAIEGKEYIGRPVPSLAQLKGNPVVLFFWAHWCPECKAESPILERLVAKYQAQGLIVVAPTQRYGYVDAGKPAGAAEELRHIVRIRDTYYGFLRNHPVPISTANHNAYGVSSTPTIVLLDRAGMVRLYHPGLMTETELDTAINQLFR